MSQFFAVRNLTEKTLSPCVPWEFAAQRPSEKICKDKESRQEWYRTKTTEWQFYGGVEPANPNQRVSKDNPPKYIHAFIADYDIKIPTERIDEAIVSMHIKPSWIERSLGGNCRLVWLLSRPLAVETTDFAIWILQAGKKFLSLDLLPGLDSGAFEDPARTYCNGAYWKHTGHPPINEIKLQSFFVEAAKKFKWKAPEGNTIPLDTVEKSIRACFPNFQWPTSFDIDSQGPTFWIPESVSPLSAIVKAEGMLTFSAHSSKPFYSWSDILGADFVKGTNEKAISRATLDIFYDGQMFFRKIKGAYQTMNDSAMKIFLKKGCGLPADKIEDAIFYVQDNNRVAGAAPFVFRTPGQIEYGGQAFLNTWRNGVLRPAESAEGFESTWINYFLQNFLDPAEQLPWILAWLQHLYKSGVELLPRPGQNLFILGGVNRGKTLFVREIVGGLVGGFVDASSYLVQGDSFGSENFHVPIWAIDDSTPSNSTAGQDRFASLLKKAAANQQHRFNEKFRVPSTVFWAGRVCVTANLDHTSSRILGTLDNGSADKTSIFRVADRVLKFPERYELQKTLKTELPIFGKWLLDYVVPLSVPRDGRYGFASYHEQRLVDTTHQTSKAAPLKEIIIEELQAFFAASPETTEWKGNLSQLCRMIQSNPLNDFICRSFRPEMINRYLELIEREGVVRCRTELGPNKTRLWIFERP